MKVEKIYLIKEGEWTKWNHTLAEAINDFYRVYVFYPNILAANDYTFSQFDFLTNVRPDERQYVSCKDDITGLKKLPKENEEIKLSSFSYDEKADLDFAIDNQLADKEFRLVYDDDPDWDEPEKPVYCPEDDFCRKFRFSQQFYRTFAF